MKEEILIIGGGLGGLMTGALLAKEGFVVTVLEKNGTVGGGLQTFHRHGIAFETGMHILGGFRPGGSLRRICTYLGVMDRLQLRPVDADCMDQITYASDGATYRIAAGREGFVESLAAYFPTEKENLRRYVDGCMPLPKSSTSFICVLQRNPSIHIATNSPCRPIASSLVTSPTLSYATSWLI